MKIIPFSLSGTELPSTPGVYLIFADDVCLYVGSSINLRTRVHAHNKKKLFKANNANFIKYVDCKEEELSDLEVLTIKQYLPTLNIVAYRSKIIRDRKLDPKNEITGEFTTIRDQAMSLIRSRQAWIGIAKISEDTGISKSWLNQFSRGAIPNPGVNTIEQLYFYFTGRKIISLKENATYESLKPSLSHESPNV